MFRVRVATPSRRVLTVGPMAEPSLVDVIFPVLDEADALAWVLGRVPPGYRAIVVDNGSTDGSGRIAEGLGARVVTEPQRGFGAACAAGLLAADAEVVAFCDADASLDPCDLPLVCDPVLAGHAGMVLGARRPTAGAWPLHARIANSFLAAWVRRHAGVAITDLGPMRAMRRDTVLELGIVDRRFGWPLEMVLRAAAAGVAVNEVDVTYHPRVGRSKVTGTVRGTMRAVDDMRRVMAEVPGPNP